MTHSKSTKTEESKMKSSGLFEYRPHLSLYMDEDDFIAIDSIIEKLYLNGSNKGGQAKGGSNPAK